MTSTETRTVQGLQERLRRQASVERSFVGENHNTRILGQAADRIDALEKALKNAVGALSYCETNALSPNDVLRPKVEVTLKAARAALSPPSDNSDAQAGGTEIK